MNKLMRKFRKFLFSFVLVIISVGIALMFVLYQKDFWRFSYNNVDVINLSICQSINQLPDGGKRISENTDEFLICGFLKSEIDINLLILILEMDSGKLVNQIHAKQIKPGYFYLKALVSEEMDSGFYQIDAYLHRNIIASTIFEINDP
jgi:hypothetical protein